MFNWLRQKQEFDTNYVTAKAVPVANIPVVAPVDNTPVTPPKKEPVISEPVISLIASLADLDAWTSEDISHGVLLTHKATGLTVKFSAFYTWSCVLAWITHDEGEALVRAFTDRRKAEKEIELGVARESFMVLVK